MGVRVTELNFKGKEFVYNHHLAVPFRPLVPDAAKGIGPVSLDGNLVIQGDNLHALKALLPLYAGKVDCIFIDPPYNTGNEGWCYSDNVNAPMIREWLQSNPIGIEDGLRHDKWCAMMWPRLRLLHELLSDRGCMAVCIGDDELHRLIVILEQIFSRSISATLTWKSRAKPHNTGSAKVKPQGDTEYVVLISKTDEIDYNLIVSGNARSYPHEDKDGRFRLQTILKSDRGENKRDTMKFAIDGYKPPAGQRWQGGETYIKDLFRRNRAGFFDGTPFLKYYEHEEAEETSPFWCYVPREFSGTSEKGKNLLNDIVGSDHGIDTVKPLEIVDYVISRVCGNEAIILDSFGGSGTTAHAVLEANKRDRGNRRFIVVEMEDYADRLTAERVRRVINGYDFKGTQKTELLRERLNWRALTSAVEIVQKVAAIETLHGHEYDRIKKEVSDAELVVTGEKTVDERAEGLGGTFTYCTLGDPVELDKVLSGETLPSFAGLGAPLFHMATNRAIDPAAMREADFYLGATEGQHVWLIYKPDLNWLKSPDAALTLARAKAFAATDPEKKHLIFAPARFVSQKMLAEQNIPVEFVPLPFALYRIDRS